MELFSVVVELLRLGVELLVALLLVSGLVQLLLQLELDLQASVEQRSFRLVGVAAEELRSTM